MKLEHAVQCCKCHAIIPPKAACEWYTGQPGEVVCNDCVGKICRCTLADMKAYALAHPEVLAAPDPAEACSPPNQPLERGHSFTCPKCGAVSHNPNDRREGYCGRCHDWTGKPGGPP